MILHIPHSSNLLPVAYPNLPLHDLNRHTDWFTDELFNHPQAEHFVFPYSRFYADMERLKNDPLELKGMGIFYTQTPWGQNYRQKGGSDYEHVIKLYHDWHSKLEDSVKSQLSDKGKCLLIDCHSFSHHQVDYVEGQLPDINIGTNKDTTSPSLIKKVTDFYESLGYSVEVNFPYAYSIEPVNDEGFQTIMIELNKRCYLTDEFIKNTGFDALKLHTHQLLNQLYEYEQSNEF